MAKDKQPIRPNGFGEVHRQDKADKMQRFFTNDTRQGGLGGPSKRPVLTEVPVEQVVNVPMTQEEQPRRYCLCPYEHYARTIRHRSRYDVSSLGDTACVSMNATLVRLGID